MFCTINSCNGLQIGSNMCLGVFQMVNACASVLDFRRLRRRLVFEFGLFPDNDEGMRRGRFIFIYVLMYSRWEMFMSLLRSIPEASRQQQPIH
jgi:hypothetical protein